MQAGVLLDEFTCLQAVGFQGLIQATRDATSAAFADLQSVALPMLAALLIFGGIKAWQDGSTFRDSASGARLAQRDLG